MVAAGLYAHAAAAASMGSARRRQGIGTSPPTLTMSVRCRSGLWYGDHVLWPDSIQKRAGVKPNFVNESRDLCIPDMSPDLWPKKSVRDCEVVTDLQTNMKGSPELHVIQTLI